MVNPELHDIPDLSILAESDQVREVYAWAGLALYYAQVLEHGIVNLIQIVLGSRGALAERYATLDEFYEVQFRKTLGRLKKDLGELDVVSPGVEQQLKEALCRRNFLVHDFFRERAELFLHLEGRRLMVEELWDATGLFIAADAAVSGVLYALGRTAGVTPEAVEEMAAELRRSTGPGP